MRWIMEINGQIVGVLKDINGRDIPAEYLKAGNDDCFSYFRVNAYKHVNGQKFLVGYADSHAEPNGFVISTVIKTFKADYAEVVTVYENVV